MKVVWFVNGMLPEFSMALGRKAGNTGGWMPSLIGAIRQYAPKIELHVICEADGDYERQVNGTYYYSFKTFNLGPWWRRDKKASFGEKIKRCIARIKPDLIHFHGTENGYLDFDDGVFCGCQLLVSLQGIISGYYPHYMGGLTARELRKYRNWLRYILTGHDLEYAADSWRKNVSATEKRCLSKVQHIAGRTKWDKAWAQTLAPHATYHHIGEVLRPEFYEGIRDQSSVKRHTIVASAALKYPLKGGHWLLEAIPYLKKDFPDVVVKFVDSQRLMCPKKITDKIRATEYHRYLRKLIKDLGIEQNVEFLPSLDAESVRAQLAMSEVFCLPSLVENSPNSLGEAQLVGVPCVATDVGGVSSMLRDGETGWLVPSGDVAMLVQSICEAFIDKEKANLFVSRSRDEALLRHDPQKIVDDLYACYCQIVGCGDLCYEQMRTFG